MQTIAIGTADELADYRPTGDVMTIDDLFHAKARTPSDISPHMPALRQLADGLDTVVEFGVRHGYSTVAFLASTCRRVISYDIEDPKMVLPPDVVGKWGFIRADTAKIETADIPPCDLLFIDTLHTADQVRQELRQACVVRKYMAFHDTLTWGCRDEGDQPDAPPRGGIVEPLLQFLANEAGTWRVKYHTPACNGLTVLERF